MRARELLTVERRTTAKATGMMGHWIEHRRGHGEVVTVQSGQALDLTLTWEAADAGLSFAVALEVASGDASRWHALGSPLLSGGVFGHMYSPAGSRVSQVRIPSGMKRLRALWQVTPVGAREVAGVRFGVVASVGATLDSEALPA